MTDHERQTLEDFARHPGWQILNDLHIEQREAKLTDIAKKLFSMNPVEEIDQKELIYWRGFFRGQRFLLNNPKLEAKKLAAERAHQESDPV